MKWGSPIIKSNINRMPPAQIPNIAHLLSQSEGGVYAPNKKQ
jgi:hypothetical protein